MAAGGPLPLPPLLPGLSSRLTPAKEAGVVLGALLAINSLPAIPLLLLWLWRRARRVDKGRRRRAWAAFYAALLCFAGLIFVPVKRRPALMQSRLWRWWLEYLSVRVGYLGGEPLPARQYFYCLVPHGLYPFSGAMACVSKMVDVFPGMRMIVASAGLRVPLIRNLMGWIGCIAADKSSIAAAIRGGDSVCVMPGGIAEMVETDASAERLILQGRQGFVRMALEHGVPIVPVYVFGSSVLWSQLPLPAWVRALSRAIRASLILPYGRFGLLVPRKLPLLYAVGRPIECPGAGGGAPTPEQVAAAHSAVVSQVQELYHTFKAAYGWQGRRLVID